MKVLAWPLFGNKLGCARCTLDRANEFIGLFLCFTPAIEVDSSDKCEICQLPYGSKKAVNAIVIMRDSIVGSSEDVCKYHSMV